MKRKVWNWRDAIRQAELSSTTKLVLLNLSIYMNDMGEGCFPSIPQQVRDTGLSERAVYVAIANAEEGGFLERKKITRRGKTCNEYVARYPDTPAPDAGDNSVDNTPAPDAPLHHMQSTPAPDAGAPLHHMQSPPHPPIRMNSPITNSPMNSSSGAQAREEDEGDVIRLFDEVLIGVFGGTFKRHQPRRDDKKHARAFLQAGADCRVLGEIFRQAMQSLADAELEPPHVPHGLAYFSAIVPEALARAAWHEGKAWLEGEALPPAFSELAKMRSLAGIRQRMRHAETEGDAARVQVWRQHFPRDVEKELLAYEARCGPVDAV